MGGREAFVCLAGGGVLRGMRGGESSGGMCWVYEGVSSS